MEDNIYRLLSAAFDNESAEYSEALAAIPGAMAFDNLRTLDYGIISSSYIFVHGLTQQMGTTSFLYDIAYVANLQDSTRATKFWNSNI